MSATINQMVSYYVSRLLFQYQKPKAQQTVAIVAKTILGDGLVLDVQDAYDPATAVGPQLDVIGKYVGLPRNIGDPAPAAFFGFLDMTGGGNPNGFTDYTSGVNANVLFDDYNYAGQRNTALSDASYAFMLALKIILNSNDGTLYSIQKLLAQLLPGFVTVIDNRDMTLTYTVSVAAPVSVAVLTPYLPKPMGVGINVVEFADIITGSGDEVVTGGGDNIIVTNP